MLTAVTAWTPLAKAKQVADNTLAVATAYKGKIDTTVAALTVSKNSATGLCTTATTNRDNAVSAYNTEVGTYNGFVTAKDNAVLLNNAASANIVTGLAEIVEQDRVKTLANEDLTAAKAVTVSATAAWNAETALLATATGATAALVSGLATATADLATK